MRARPALSATAALIARGRLNEITASSIDSFLRSAYPEAFSGDAPSDMMVTAILANGSGLISAGLEGKITMTNNTVSGHIPYTKRKLPMTAVDTAYETPGIAVNALAWAPAAGDPSGASFYAAYSDATVVG